MAWVGPAIMAGQAVAGWISNKKKEKAAKKQAQLQYQQQTTSPVSQAIRAYLKDYWVKHNLQERAPGLNIDDLLAPRPFNPSGYKSPGAGGQLGNGLLDALASYYGSRKPSTTVKPSPAINNAATTWWLGAH